MLCLCWYLCIYFCLLSFSFHLSLCGDCGLCVQIFSYASPFHFRLPIHSFLLNIYIALLQKRLLRGAHYIYVNIMKDQVIQSETCIQITSECIAWIDNLSKLTLTTWPSIPITILNLRCFSLLSLPFGLVILCWKLIVKMTLLDSLITTVDVKLHNY